MKQSEHILVVDDDPGIRALIGDFLGQHGYLVRTADGGAAMRAALAEAPADLIVLDIMMPGEDGLEVLRALDPADRPGVILLSTLGSDIDRIVGLELGADDYLPKPCNPRELLARIRAVLRRRGGPRPADPSGPVLRFAGWALDPVARVLTDPGGQPALLTDGEFRLLIALTEHPRRVLSRDFLLERAHGLDSDSFDRAIDVQVSRLRKKLGDDGTLIRTVRNEGYMFTADVEQR